MAGFASIAELPIATVDRGEQIAFLAADGLSLGVVESVSDLLALLERTDGLSIVVVDGAVGLAVELGSTDTLAVALADAGFVVVRIDLVDGLAPDLAEAVTGLTHLLSRAASNRSIVVGDDRREGVAGRETRRLVVGRQDRRIVVPKQDRSIQ